MRVAFLHPDLGLGGAERLVVDGAVALSKAVRRPRRDPTWHANASGAQGHQVDMFTSHFDESRCFDEARDGRFFLVRVYGDWLPRHVWGALHILFAMLRNIWLALSVALAHERYDVIICDQVSVCVPVLRLFAPSSRVLFYCHFPDKLLSERKNLCKWLYRLPFDLVEEITTLMADRIVVNSKFTSSVFRKAFPLACGLVPEVLYPCVPIDEELKL
jgi:hypothetical protein